MAKATRLSPLKNLRERSEITREQLAEALQVSVKQVTAFERSLDSASAPQLSDIAAFLDCTVETLRGKPDANLRSPGVAYGTFKVVLGSYEAEYPIDTGAFDLLSSQIASQDIQEEPREPAWIHATTLDNKFVFVNLSYVEQIELVNDNVEAMPEFHHPEVYKVLGEWDLHESIEMGPVVEARVSAVLDSEDSADAIKAAQNTRIVMGSGTQNWHFFLGVEETLGFYTLELESGLGIAPNRLMRVRNEGFYVGRYVNLSKVAIMEVPLARYYEALEESDDVADE